MRRWGRWAGLALAVLLAGLFAFFNGGERVTLHAGFTVLYRISLVGLVFVAFLLGMVVMFLVGIEHDLRVRSLLREYRLGERFPGDLEPPRPGAGEGETASDRVIDHRHSHSRRYLSEPEIEHPSPEREAEPEPPPRPPEP